MKAAEVATLRELVETLVPAANASRIAELAREALVRAADPAQVLQLRLVLRLLEQPLANLVSGAPGRAFRDLGVPEREALLLRWAGSPIPQKRTAFHALRGVLSFLAYADPGTAEAPNSLPAGIGYVPDRPAIASEPTPIRPLDLPRVPSAHEGPLELSADVVIVGSGAGGGVVAAELSRAGRSVVILEAGPFVAETSMPRGELDAYGRLYLNHGLLSTWDGSVTILAGSGVGGGTLVNWMTCIDVPEAVRREWAVEHGLDGLDGPEWTADLAAIERELGVSTSTVVPPKDELILRGATALGWNAARIRRNATDCGECGSCPFGCVAGKKQSGIRSDLRRAFEDGARIVDRVRVTRVLMERGAVVGVEGNLLLTDPVTGMPLTRDGESNQALVRRLVVRAPQVVLAAGALRTPAILQLSGVGHSSIGRNLRLHPVPLIAAVMPEPVDMWRGTMQAARSLEFVNGDQTRRGYVIESAPGHLGLLALALPWEGAADHAALTAVSRHIAPLIAITRDGGEGRTTLTRARRVRIDYHLDFQGIATLRHALVAMARIARAGGANEIIGVGMPTIRHRVDGADERARFAVFEADLGAMDYAPNRGSLFSAHQMGTVRLGADPASHPADPRGRIRANSRGSVVRGLYVADASTFPTAAGVNPMLGIMAMARRISRTVLAEGPGSG